MKQACRDRGGFTLLEVLVALAVLAVMMACIFSLVQAGTRLWERGNKRIEATQAARVGLNAIADLLGNALAAKATTFNTSGNPLDNYVLFENSKNPQDTLNLGGGATNAAGSHQLRAVVATGNPASPYHEIGLMSVFLGSGDGAMEPSRYYLVLKSIESGSYFLRTDGTWTSNNGTVTNFIPLTDNCIRLTFRYYGNAASADGTPGWLDEWTPWDRLPLGVLVTLTVLDSRSAEKLKVLTNGAALADADITNGIAAALGKGSASNTTQLLISQAAVTMSRFIPLNRR